MDILTIRIDSILRSKIGIRADFKRMSLSNISRILLAEAIMKYDNNDKDKEFVEYVNFLKYDLTRKFSSTNKEKNHLLANLKNMCIRSAINGNSAENIFKIYNDELDRIEMMLSKKDLKDAMRIKLKTIKQLKNRIEDMQVRQGFKVAEIKKIDFHAIMKMRAIDNAMTADGSLKNRDIKAMNAQGEY
jgi:hypothetical protein